MSEKTATPFVHVVQRAGITASKQIVIRLAAIVLALVTGGLFLLALGQNPLDIYGTMVSGALGSSIAFRETVKIAIPLCVTALGVTLAFKMKFWNIGAEGQICMGAIAGSFFAYTFGKTWPSGLLIPVMLLAGILFGGLWGMIPAWFKTRFGTNETLFTLMLNYVAQYFIQYLREGPWKDPTAMGFPMRYTKHGYELTVVGANENTARYAGMPVKKIILRTMFLSAAICGLAGVMQVSGADMQLTDSVAGGVGFTAIIVSWLARLSPLGILVTSFLFGVLEKGSGTIESVFKLSPSMADVLQGIILFFVLGAEFFINYQLKFRRGKAKGGVKA